MPKNKNVSNRDNDVNNSTDFDLYSDDKTKEIVGSLFDEFVEDGGTNYFADYKDSFLDAENDEEDESLGLGESISRRRKRSLSNEGKSIVFRKKTKKAKPEDEYDDYDEDTYEDTEDKAEDDEDNEDSGSDLEKTIILPKLSNLFKKAEKDDDDDDEIDEFFASLTKDSAARAQAAASQESEPEEKQAEKPRRQRKAQNTQNNGEKKTEEISEQPKPRKRIHPAVVSEPEIDDDDDDLEEKLVEISVSRIASVAVIIIALVIIAALAYKNHSYAKQLDDARAQITELQKNSSSTYETELDELKKQVSELTAENESLKADDAVEDPHASAIEILNEAQSEISTQPSDEGLSQGVSGGNTYTVKAGDTIEKISKNQYGNASGVQKILQANNLTESSTLQIGQVLTIPN